ncbi:hypothetical protein DRN69_08710 [Candidatus Pacearchaeota archaeon]|nr:MAG: hypothetical protein DRN69_08710 [Candidatus Pacearchaeota archaeon]
MKKMNVRKVLVSFLTIATLLLLATTVSATELTSDYTVKVNGIDVIKNTALTNTVSVIAGETITIKVYFTSSSDVVDASDVRMKAEIEGEKQDVDARTDYFDVEPGKRYVKTLTLKVPYELKDYVSNDLALNIKIWNDNYKTELPEITLRVQRPSYAAEILSISTSDTVNAGELLPIDVVVKNRGYNSLEDLFITVRIPALDIEKRVYFGDLVEIESTDEDDTAKERVYLRIPFDVEGGIYSLQVEASNEDTVSSVTKEILIKNEFPSTVIKTSEGLLLVNPTNTLKVYKVLFPSGNENIVSIQAGSSKTVQVNPTSEEYVVTVLTIDGKIVESVTFSSSEAAQISNPVVVLTVILAIVFLVLLIVLIVLVTKKPEKKEEFGESYY